MPMVEGISNNKIVRIILLLIIGLMFICALFGSFYTVNEGDRGVVLRNGEMISVSNPGLHFKMPFIDTVHDMTVRTQRLGYKLQVYSSDAQPIVVTISANYQINPTIVNDVYAQYGMNYKESLIIPQILAIPKIVFGTFTAVDIVTKRNNLTTQIFDMMVSKFHNTGIIMESVQLEDIDFSDEYERAVEARMTAEVEVEKVTKNAEKELQTLRITKTKSEAAAYAYKQEADAKAHAVRVVGEAEAYAIEVKSQAMAKQPNYVELIKAERWNGVLPATMIPNNSIPIIGK